MTKIQRFLNQEFTPTEIESMETELKSKKGYLKMLQDSVVEAQIEIKALENKIGFAALYN
ncbi:hypothetical protein MUN82_01800 [Hymenobacter aerilatus]|uniref:Uncharacterized protein n=1 Tax=Hymenobacter aerilatus TaxID=2932251 RepID=A0A8T9SY45_9BACT|nr:hypothetical protein [Hymenobacter aerilatus]UOR05844.1 hypothetical protein MUN82_01800 [Hymenobacter aerilatus]